MRSGGLFRTSHCLCDFLKAYSRARGIGGIIFSVLALVLVAMKINEWADE